LEFGISISKKGCWDVESSDGLKLREIGAAMNLTERRIPQIPHKAPANLREALSVSPQPSGRR
jgi:DNA-directed RNA polymerase sigma subunit (sigma70/sigma32)